MLGFEDMSTLVGHFVLSPREREKRDRRDSTGDEREGQGRKRNRNESEETEEIKTFQGLRADLKVQWTLIISNSKRSEFSVYNNSSSRQQELKC